MASVKEICASVRYSHSLFTLIIGCDNKRVNTRRLEDMIYLDFHKKGQSSSCKSHEIARLSK